MPANRGALADCLREFPLDDEAGSGAQFLERVLAAGAKSNAGIQPLLSDAPAGELRAFLSGAFAGSSYLFDLAERCPAWLTETLNNPPEEHFQEILRTAAHGASAAAGTKEIMHVLREAKNRMALLVALADLGGVWSVEEATKRLSLAADQFISLAVRFLLTRAAQANQFSPRDASAPERDSGLIVLGMGKLGAHELNYSSDIDLIVFFDREAAPVAGDTEAGSFFVRLTRDLIHILQEQTADGYVFRTDLRLRPDPGSTQAAISIEAAFRYYEGLGQNWERAALIKARPVAGDIAAGEAFLRALNPYIWRKYLDYNAINDIHAMKRQIHAARGHEKIAVAGHNIKLGRGGIREIEFFVQSQQLIAGGRQPALRTSRTLDALAKLQQFGWITAKARDDMSEAYRFLRRVEHRLQMMADQQTHTLPSNQLDLSRFARFAAYKQLADFERDLRGHMQRVQEHYAALFETVPELTPGSVRGSLVFTGVSDDPDTVATLRKLGYKNPAAAIAAIKGWHYGRYRAMRSARAREILTEFTPALLEALGGTGDPDLALATFDSFLKEVPTALQLFSMLRANPELLRLIAQIMGSAPRLAHILGRRRAVMDGILDPGYLSSRHSAEELKGLIHREVMDARSYEDRLNLARILGQEQAFAIGVQLLTGELSPAEAGEAYSLLAEALIEVLLDTVQAFYGGTHPLPAVIAMGKLGGREMTAASDLDLIVVYDASGEKAAQASQHYARLTQRLISALSAQTAEGALYQVDLRLRPSGKAGPVAVRLDSFLGYQRDEAWTWEHLALTRARPVAGPREIRERLESLIREVLTMRRVRAKVAADVREMRALIEKEKGTADLWDTRNYKGGLVDVEFVAQFLQIVHAADDPSILSTNTMQALRNLTASGILSAAQSSSLLRAAELYQGVAHILRLCTEGRFDLAAAPGDLISLLLRTTGEPDIARLEARLNDSYAEVAQLFAAIVA